MMSFDMHITILIQKCFNLWERIMNAFNSEYWQLFSHNSNSQGIVLYCILTENNCRTLFLKGWYCQLLSHLYYCSVLWKLYEELTLKICIECTIYSVFEARYYYFIFLSLGALSLSNLLFAYPIYFVHPVSTYSWW